MSGPLIKSITSGVLLLLLLSGNAFSGTIYFNRDQKEENSTDAALATNWDFGSSPIQLYYAYGCAERGRFKYAIREGRKVFHRNYDSLSSYPLAVGGNCSTGKDSTTSGNPVFQIYWVGGENESSTGLKLRLEDEKGNDVRLTDCSDFTSCSGSSGTYISIKPIDSSKGTFIFQVDWDDLCGGIESTKTFKTVCDDTTLATTGTGSASFTLNIEGSSVDDSVSLEVTLSNEGPTDVSDLDPHFERGDGRIYIDLDAGYTVSKAPSVITFAYPLGLTPGSAEKAWEDNDIVLQASGLKEEYAEYQVGNLTNGQSYYAGVTVLNSSYVMSTTGTATEETTPGRIYGVLDEDKCFIATAAFGSKFQTEVTILRNFRDRVLRKFKLGNDFIRTYYETSPPYARELKKHPVLKRVVRGALLPLVLAAKLSTPFQGVLGLFAFFGILALELLFTLALALVFFSFLKKHVRSVPFLKIFFFSLTLSSLFGFSSSLRAADVENAPPPATADPEFDLESGGDYFLEPLAPPKELEGQKNMGLEFKADEGESSAKESAASEAPEIPEAVPPLVSPSETSQVLEMPSLEGLPVEELEELDFPQEEVSKSLEPELKESESKPLEEKLIPKKELQPQKVHITETPSGESNSKNRNWIPKVDRSNIHQEKFQALKTGETPSLKEIYEDIGKGIKWGYSFTVEPSPIEPSVPGGDGFAYSQIYDQEAFAFNMGADWMFLKRSWGTLGVDSHLGVSMARGKGIFRDAPVEESRVTFRFVTVPASLGLSYRVHGLRWVIPYFEAGFLVVPYRESRSDDASKKKGGISWGGRFAGGIMVALDWLHRKSAWDLYQASGMKRSYLIAGFTSYQATNGVTTKLQSIDNPVEFSDTAVEVGLRLEF